MPREARGSGAAEEAIEDGFGLIVESMAGGDGVAMARVDLALEKIVAGAAGFLFDVAAAGWGFENVHGEVGTVREIADEDFVGFRFHAAEVMIDVEDRGGEAEGVEGVEEKYGIGPARDGDPDAASGRSHPVLPDGFGNLAGHVSIVAYVVGIRPPSQSGWDGWFVAFGLRRRPVSRL